MILLLKIGALQETEERRGRTGQVKVYRVPDLIPSSETGPKTEHFRNSQEEAQSSVKEARFSRKEAQYRATEPLEPKEEPTEPIAPSSGSPQPLRLEGGEIPKINGAEAIPVNTGDDWHVPNEMLFELNRLYPAVDVPQTLREIRGWCLGTPRRRKTVGGVRRFVFSWFAREQDKHGR